MSEKLGKYEIIKEIGKGAMGVVYLAFDPVIERQVAIKTMNDESFRDKEQRSRFLREAKSAGGLQHPNIVTIYDMGESEGTPYIVMEFVEGNDLDELIGENKLTLENKLKIMIQLMDALSFAHSNGIVHRDIKPSNIRVLKDKKVKVMDFGIAKKQDSDLTRTGLVVGTISYMSPEQIQGKPVSFKSDQFSAGTVFYQLMTGKKPFEGENITSVIFKIISLKPDAMDMTGVPVFIANIIKKMMANETDNRFSDCIDIAEVLKSELISMGTGRNNVPTSIIDRNEKPVNIPPIPVYAKEGNVEPPINRRAMPKKKKNSLAIVVFSIIFLLVIGVGVGGYYIVNKARKNFKEVTRLDNNVQQANSIDKNVLNNEVPKSQLQNEMEKDLPIEENKVVEDLTVEENKLKDIKLTNEKQIQENKLDAIEKNTLAGENLNKSNKSAEIKDNKTENNKPVYINKQLNQRLESKEVFVKEGEKKVTVQTFQVFQEFRDRIEKVKKISMRMPASQKKGKGNQLFNNGRVFMSNGAYKPAALNFYLSTIYDPLNSHSYANLIICLEKMKAYQEANLVIEKALKHGISVSTMKENVMFGDSYEKVIANK